MKPRTSANPPPNIEFLPFTAAPKGSAFKLLGDVLNETGLAKSIDLVSAIRNGLDPVVYLTTDGGEMFANPGSWKLGLDIVVGNRAAQVERQAEHAAQRREVT
jgi:hypothetical protein